MHIKILKKMLSILCVAAMSFSITLSSQAIKSTNGALNSQISNCNSSISFCLNSINHQLNYFNNYKSLGKFDNLDQVQTDSAIKLLINLKNIIEKINGLCINDSETLNSIFSIINTVKPKINLINSKMHYKDCFNIATAKLNDLKKIFDIKNKLKFEKTNKIKTNAENLVEKLKTKIEKLLDKIKNKNICRNAEEKCNELILELDNMSSPKFDINLIELEIKKLDDFFENLLSVDSQAAEYYVLNSLPTKIQNILSKTKKMQIVAPVPNKTTLQTTGGGKKMQIVHTAPNKTTLQTTGDGKKMQIVKPVPNKTTLQTADGGKKMQNKGALIKDAKDALNNCDSTLSNSSELFKNCDKNYVKQALSFASQLFSNAKQSPTDNVILTKCVKAWQALNEINLTKEKISNYDKILQDESLENECLDALYKCFENFKNNNEFNLSNIKYINDKLNQAMRSVINKKISSINNLQPLADVNLQAKWTNEIQAGRQFGPSCWLFAATNARNWFRVKGGESRIYGFESVKNEYVKNKGNARDLKSDQDYEPIVKYLNNCQLSTYIVTSDVGNNDKGAQETNRFLAEVLLKKHFSSNQSAVVVNKPGHWVAVAGINTQTQKILVVDSLGESPYWSDFGSFCNNIANIRDRKNPNCNGLSMIFVKDDHQSNSKSVAFQNEDLSDWLNIFDDAIKAASGEF